ncbi:unnamed protein product [Rotaria sordida]|uniref:Uncharacterized protein n=1 Tax=Rotaria sordida TaxID=392033 RepID=A0A813XFI0_9BILA|nr:unnamed protein product [Rotaria sordida]CAF1158322.1 unnamed protein product [Rotaria sordida]
MGLSEFEECSSSARYPSIDRSLTKHLIELSNSPFKSFSHDSGRDSYSLKHACTSHIDEISSDYSQRRSYSSTGIIHEKSNRNGQTDNDSYDITPKASSNSRRDTISHSHSIVHPTTHSFVPNTQLTTVAKRSSQRGHSGQRIEVYTNHFQIKFSKQSNKTIFYQFNVDVELLMSGGSWHSCNRHERLEVLQKIIKQEHFPLVWDDNRKYLYAKEDLTYKFKKEYQCEIYHKTIERNDKFRFLINLVKTYELQSDELGIGSGYYQAIVLSECGPTLNINNIYRCFYRNYDLIEFLSFI